jgi:predicted metal-dependent enzyme (double-stranded beta helix superfamily)
MGQIVRLRRFIRQLTNLVDECADNEGEMFARGVPLLAELVAHDDWLPGAFAQASAERYQQNLLYCDPRERFSVVSFVWGPGQSTPVHDHTVWGMIGMLRGAETCEEYRAERIGAALHRGDKHVLRPGEIDRVSPSIGDIHRVSNALADRPSISIHVYGGNIGAIDRHVFEESSGAVNGFVSGYSNHVLPNLWDRAAEMRAALGR